MYVGDELVHRVMKKISRLSKHHALKRPYSKHIYEQLKNEGKSAKEALQIIGICSQINSLISKPDLDKSQYVSFGHGKSEYNSYVNWKDGHAEEAEEDSLSINTSDADDIESEYYIDDAINKKVCSMNKNFEDRVNLMTKVMIDRIEESSSSDEHQNLIKNSHGAYKR